MAEMTAQKAQAEILYALLEYTAVFEKPILAAWRDSPNLISAVLSALDPFGFKLDGVECKTQTERLSEYAIVFRRSPPGATFTVGLGKLVVQAENVSWTDAERLITGMTAGINAILRIEQGEIHSQQISLGIHVQLKEKSRKEVTAPLLNPVALKILDEEVTFQGIILQHEKSLIVIDASLAYANGLFVRIIRDYPPDAKFEQMAEVLRRDEARLFDVLGLEEVK